MGVQRRTVSHFKGLFKTFKMRYSTFLYSYWIGLHVHFKKAILHLKRAFVKYVLATTVSDLYNILFVNHDIYYTFLNILIGINSHYIS